MWEGSAGDGLKKTAGKATLETSVATKLSVSPLFERSVEIKWDQDELHLRKTGPEVFVSLESGDSSQEEEKGKDYVGKLSQPQARYSKQNFRLH